MTITSDDIGWLILCALVIWRLVEFIDIRDQGPTVQPWIRAVPIDWLLAFMVLVLAGFFVAWGDWWTLPAALYIGNRWAGLYGWTWIEVCSDDDRIREHYAAMIYRDRAARSGYADCRCITDDRG